MCTCSGCFGVCIHPGDTIHDGELIAAMSLETKKRKLSQTLIQDLDEEEVECYPPINQTQSIGSVLNQTIQDIGKQNVWNTKSPRAAPPVVSPSKTAVSTSGADAASQPLTSMTQGTAVASQSVNSMSQSGVVASPVVTSMFQGAVASQSVNSMSQAAVGSHVHEIQQTLFANNFFDDDTAVEITMEVAKGKACPFIKCHNDKHTSFKRKKKINKDIPFMNIAGASIGLCIKSPLNLPKQGSFTERVFNLGERNSFFHCILQTDCDHSSNN